ncbi:hypothetical protein CYLTODRAFT_229286 [Cylindrobasidium torrendii FP15055 ss-10]|uniref:Uncharacterized protein n=1 Tax=Cylindrobasidium torrendii FP15055 ss-10 TaxID=1314674 RepID=A0A0D7BGZ7_9AGAR|nr:hypothetical protein CYLTODRAFT_229286 [Cylindrobasidium torrendii FP15055 ss-10]
MYLYHFIYSSEHLSETGQCSGRSEACGAALGAPPMPMIAARVESDSSQHVGRLESDSDSTHGNTILELLVTELPGKAIFQESKQWPTAGRQGDQKQLARPAKCCVTECPRAYRVDTTRLCAL